MNFAELVNEVYTLTGRPDRVAETSSAIKSATLKLHQSDYYYQDIFETGIAFNSADYVQQLDYRALLPRFSAIKYLRKYDNTSGTPMGFLSLITPEQVLDDYKIQKVDVFYAAGAYLQINSSTKEKYYLMGCYLNPDITESGYDSWIAQDHPFAIVFDAAATVFKAIGKDEEAAAYRTLVNEQIAILKAGNIVANGF
jgi:hypothetical protein